MKKFITIVVLLLMCLNINPVKAQRVEEEENNIGTYFQLGTYEDDPIIWRCISDDDENGMLLLSDKILCYKAYNAGTNVDDFLSQDMYGSDIWENTTIRAWLNAIENAGNIIWPGNNPPNTKVPLSPFMPYVDEDGFLSERNFSISELSVMKTVSQWQILGPKNAHLSTNGLKKCFQTNYYPFISRYGKYNVFSSGIRNFSHIEGAMYRLSDTMFLIDEAQIYKLWTNFGTVRAYPTQRAFDSVKNDKDYYEGFEEEYMLRTSNRSAQFIFGDDDYSSGICAYSYGVRPAFYLDTTKAEIISGSGSIEEPYIIDGQPQTNAEVYCNGERMQFDEEPVEESERLLVPVRAIFEELGAEVEWEEETQIITAKKEDTTVVMQIDNPEMGNSREVVTLEVPPRLVGERTMVPLRAVSEAFEAKVDYIENLNRVVVDQPKLPMDFGERLEIPMENGQRKDFESIFPDYEPF